MPTPEDFTIPDKLDSINVTKQAIRQAIVDKGVEVPEGTTFYEYAGKIGEIKTGGGTYTISSYSGILDYGYLPSEAKAGDIVFIFAGSVQYDTNITIKEYIDGSVGEIITGPWTYKSISELPESVKPFLENVPQTLAAPPEENKYTFFVMPPCDVYVS